MFLLQAEENQLLRPSPKLLNNRECKGLLSIRAELLLPDFIDADLIPDNLLHRSTTLRVCHREVGEILNVRKSIGKGKINIMSLLHNLLFSFF